MEHRTYLWLHLTFKTIEQELGKYYKLSDMETILSDIPSQVSEAYEKILNRSEHKHETETLLQIVLAAKRPLTLDEANIALTMALKSERFDSHSALKSNMCPRKSFKDTVRYLCGLLIGVYDSKLLFIHQTAREFLIHRERRGNWQGRFNLTRAHGKMALICLEYLSYLDEEQSVWDIREDCPLAEYSSEYWTDHVKVAETEEDVQEGVLNFFLEQKQAYAVWGELLRDQSERMAIGSEMAPPLYYASATGLVRIADLLLKSGADANAQGGYYGSALQAGSYDGIMELVQLLLDKGADVNAQGGYFGNALQAASYRGDEELVELLLKRGADVNAQGGKYGTALQAASSEGHIELVQLLLERGANVNAQGGEYGNALQAASLVGCKELVELLLDRGADVNAQGGEYGNALRAAEIVGNDEVVKLLLERGANANAHGGH
ncbi:hypothetical protein VTN31DRAFT_2934 [Thermomyces dupontii]|uniref:uncharacterized protein n=1 Tax=Talaromyces thermophilus TaxID=28565 RepID=UPI003744A8C3